MALNEASCDYLRPLPLVAGLFCCTVGFGRRAFPICTSGGDDGAAHCLNRNRRSPLPASLFGTVPQPAPGVRVWREWKVSMPK